MVSAIEYHQTGHIMATCSGSREDGAGPILEACSDDEEEEEDDESGDEVERSILDYVPAELQRQDSSLKVWVS